MGPLGRDSGSKYRQRSEAFEAVFNLLHHAYSLGFVPVADGQLHSLDVRVKKAA